MSNKLKTILKATGRILTAIPRFVMSCIGFVRANTWAEIKERIGERHQKLKTDMRRKHRFVVMDSETFCEKWSFELKGINLFVGVGVATIILIVLTSLLIAFTSLREYIPGYMRTDIMEQAYENSRMLDSLELALAQQERQLQDLKMVISGQPLPSEEAYRHKSDTSHKVQSSEYKHSKADSLLREEVESADQYQLKPSKINKLVKKPSQTSSVTFSEAQTTTTTTTTAAIATAKSPSLMPFFTPLNGKISRSFNEKDNHFGIDVSGTENSVVKSIYNGTVLLASFTPETGYIIVIQHPNNYISVCKHCGSLLKRAGDVVRAGDPVAFLGDSGSKNSDPYLHFELWYNGKPINPQSYVNF